jgi:hypothetical protein
VNLINLPVTGTYKVNVEPQGPSTMSFSLTLSQDLTGTLTTGTPVGVTLSTAGQQALLSFTATAGQSAALSMSAISTIPSGKAMTMRLYNPSGNEVGLGSGATSTTQTTVNLTNLVVGTYTVLVTPQDAATGSTQVLIQ